MIRRLRPRSLYDVLATLAFFGVLTGGVAYAANTIGSSDIIDESILSQDVKDGEIKTADIRNNAVHSNKIADESLTGNDIQDNTIGGADVNESFLPAVSTFATHNPADFVPSSDAQVIWTGDSTGGQTGGAFIHLSAPGRVFATATLNFYAPGPTSTRCQLGVIKQGISRTAIGIASDQEEFTDSIPDYIPHSFVVPVSAGTQVAAGDYGANVTCSGSATFRSGTILFWAMPA